MPHSGSRTWSRSSLRCATTWRSRAASWKSRSWQCAGQVEVARASLNTVRERLSASGGRSIAETRPGAPTTPRLSIPPLSSEREQAVPGPTLSDLRAAVDALKRPRRGEQVNEGANEEEDEESHPRNDVA